MTRRDTDHRLRVLVCGGAAGTGLACGEAFADRGAELILADHAGTALRQAAGRLGASAHVCDAIVESSVARFAAEIAASYGSIDVLINAAGRGYVRSLGMMRMTRALLPLLHGGTGLPRFVFNLAPVEGFASPEGIFPYASSVEAFERLFESLADQVRGTSVELASITPRIVRARLGHRAPVDQLYRLQRVDEQHTAKLIVERVAAARPDWRQWRPVAVRRA